MSSIPPRISMISLAVSDLEAARAFYEDGLGLPRLDVPAGVYFFELNGTWLGLCERGHLARDAGVAADGSGFRGVTLSHNVASKDDVAPTVAQAVAAGATIVKPPQDADWGGHHAYFADPDGHLWEVAYNPFAWVGPKDEPA